MIENPHPPEFAEGRAILTQLDTLFQKALEKGELEFEEATQISSAREIVTKPNTRGQKVEISRNSLEYEEMQEPTQHGYLKYDVSFEPTTYQGVPDKPGLIRGEFGVFENGAVSLSSPTGVLMGLVGDYESVREVLKGIV